MIIFYNTSEQHKRAGFGYVFVDLQCLGKACWNPCAKHINLSKIGVRSNVMPQSFRSKRAKVCCTRYANINVGKLGCPDGYEYDPNLAKQRINEGWRTYNT